MMSSYIGVVFSKQYCLTIKHRWASRWESYYEVRFYKDKKLKKRKIVKDIRKYIENSDVKWCGPIKNLKELLEKRNELFNKEVS